MNNLIRHITSLIFISLSLSAYPISYSFRGLSETNGLSDLTVSALYKDSVGYLWIGTATSVECFDGFRFKHYPIFGDDEKLKWVNVIAETQGNQILVGNDMGLWRINKESGKLEPFVAEVIKFGVRSLLTDAQGTLYIGSEKGLFVCKNNELEQITINADMWSSDNFIVDLNMGEKDTLWILTRSKLYSMNLSTRKITLCPCGDNDRQDYTYRKMARIGSRLYLGTMEHGVVVYDIPTGKFRDNWIDLGCNVISSLSGDGKDILYVGTDGNGVHFVSVKENKVMKSFRYEPGTNGGIRSNSVYSLLVDREGLIWVGFYQLGLDYTLYQSGLFSTYSYSPYFDSKDIPVRAIAINENERLIGSRNGLFYVDETKRRFRSFKSPQLRSNMIMCIYPFQGKYYIGTYGGGMYILDSSTLTIHDFEPSETPFVKGHVFCIKSDNDGCLWIATSMGLYQYKDGEQLNHYTSSNSKLPEGNVLDICFDSTGKGWICTATGLCIWDPSTRSIKSDVFPEGFIHKEKIRTVYEDSSHELYFLPDKGPIFISDLSMTHFRRFQPGTLLEGKDAMFMIEDREGWLWIGTNLGLYRYDKKSTIVPYTFVDGLPSSVFITCCPVIDASGTIWFGNSKGLIYLTRDLRDINEENSYPLAITDVYVNGKEPYHPAIQREQHLYKVSLESSHKNLTICFSGFTYSDPAYMSYEYKMEGMDDDWQLLGGKSELTYYDLSSGKYQFKIRRIGEPGSEICLSVTIASSFNATLWGTILLLIAIICLSYAYYRRKKNSPALAVDAIETGKPVVEEKYRKSNVSMEECHRLANELDMLMQEKRLYVNPDLKIADLASVLNVSPYTLSYVFNQFLNKNYYDYLNDYRIAEFKRLLNEDEYSKYTLSALAELCGFSSRTSFFRYFKKTTGITPNEYVQSIGRTNED